MVVDKRNGGESGAKNSIHFGTYIFLEHTKNQKRETLFIENPFVADTWQVGNVYRYPDNPINIWTVGDLVGVSIISLLIIFLGWGFIRSEDWN